MRALCLKVVRIHLGKGIVQENHVRASCKKVMQIHWARVSFRKVMRSHRVRAFVKSHLRVFGKDRSRSFRESVEGTAGPPLKRPELVER